MVNRRNIQHLFDQISIERIVRYMDGIGWYESKSENPDVVAFEKCDDDDEKRVWIWKSNDHPRFRSRIQNLVFSLAVMNQKEPIEVANAIYDSQEKSAPAIQSSRSADPSQSSVVIFNGQQKPISLRLGHWGDTVSLAANERTRVLIDAGEAEFVFDDHKISINSDRPDAIQLFEVRSSIGDLPDFKEIVSQAFQSVDDGRAIYDSIVADIEPAISRINFELSGIPASPESEPFVRKSVAMLLTTIAANIPKSFSSAAEVIWNICSGVLASKKIEIQLEPQIGQSLWRTVNDDDVHAPTHTLDWLMIHTCSRPSVSPEFARQSNPDQTQTSIFSRTE